MISADGPAATLFDVNGSNSGTLLSRGGVGLAATGNVGTPFTNSGLIQGATAGAQGSVAIDNSGTIRGGTIGVGLDPYGSLVNRAGGVVTGQTLDAGTSSLYGFTFNASIYNAGTITGGVDFGGTAVTYYGSNNIYDALPGGVLNGDLHLGTGNDTFVTDLVNTGSGQYAGVTGSVTGLGSETIRYRVATDATATLAAPGFSRIGYDLYDGAHLTLTQGDYTAPLLFSGAGTVDFTADLTSDAQPLVQTSQVLGLPGSPPAANALALVSHGSLTTLYDNQFLYPYATVALDTVDNFTNAGTISVRNTAGNLNSGISAIVYGDRVTNTGTISLSGATGIYYAASFVNTGTLTQEADGNLSLGLVNVPDVTNSGTISVGGTAISAPGVLGRVDNSGTIVSTGGLAVDLGYATIDNREGGVISGAGDAIHAFTATLNNAGMINGNVDVGYTPFSRSPLTSTVTNSGVINGDLRFGDGDDTLVEGASATLNGIADGGADTDALTINATSDGTFDARHFVNFESLTQIGTGNVTYSGDVSTYPTIALQGGTITVAQGTTLATSGTTTISGGNAGVGVVNNGTIAGDIALGAGEDSVVNNGAIGGAVTLGAGDDSFTEGPGSSVTGGVDGGAGTDTYRVALAGDRTGIGARIDFEALAVRGTGTLHLTLDQDFASVSLAGAGLDLRTGTFAVGPITGSDAAESLALDHDVASVDLGGGNDTLTTSAAALNGSYAGGAGADTLRLTSTSPVTIGGTVTGFETVALTGGALTVTGTLGAAGDTIAFGDGAQTVTIAAGASVPATLDLGAGDDTLVLSDATVTGRYLGGAGNDTLRLGGTGPVTIGGTVSGFETVVAASNSLTVTGTFDAAGETTSLGGGAQTLTIANGGTLVGTVDLGGGDDSFRLAAGGTLAGTVSGGAGTNSATLDLVGDRTLDGGQLQNFATLTTTGAGTLVFGSGAASFGQLNLVGGLTVASSASLTAGQVTFGPGDDRFTIAGGFTGSVNGGAGNDTLSISGGARPRR